MRERVSYEAVSIHVPLAEHDKAWRAGRSVSYRFNSRAPRGARQV